MAERSLAHCHVRLVVPLEGWITLDANGTSGKYANRGLRHCFGQAMFYRPLMVAHPFFGLPRRAIRKAVWAIMVIVN